MPDLVRFRKIDETNIGDHHYLTLDDGCAFLHEYTSGQRFNFSETNSLISNLKKKPSHRGRPGFEYKARAIRDCARAMRGAINHEWLKAATLIPVPSSKAKNDPDFDDRMAQVCRAIGIGLPFNVDVREVVVQRASRQAAHESDHRPTIHDLVNGWDVDQRLTVQAVRAIGVVDDVITSGTHFKAMQQVLAPRFPNVQIVGLFIARRVFLPNAADADF